MFGIFKKKQTSQVDALEAQTLRILNKEGIFVLLITQSGKPIFVSESLKSRSRSWLGGQVLEVMISRPAMDPYFIYYENEDYYHSMAAGGQPLSAYQDYDSYRSGVSQCLCQFLILHLLRTKGHDISHEQMSFSHNRIHTNVIAYVDRLKSWYPIQHSSEEPDSATQDKVAQVNSGAVAISDVIAISEPSPV